MPETDQGPGRSRAWWTSEGTRWVFVTLLIPFAGFVWNEVQEREAERQKAIERVRAEEQARVADARSESDIVIRLMPALASPDEASPTRGIALAILLNLASREALAPELVSAVQVAVDNTQQRVREGTATEAERAALSRIAAATDRLPADRVDGGAPVAGESPRPTAARELQVEVPRVYVHIFDEAQRNAADALTRWITGERRWLAPGIENVAATAERAGRTPPAGRPTADVRYFNDEDRGDAQEISAWLTRAGTPAVVTQVRNLRAPAGQVEVWFPASPGS
jgi:hypothetical protein